MRNIFLEKTCTKCGPETSPRPFFKKAKLNISLDQQPEICFYCTSRSRNAKTY